MILVKLGPRPSPSPPRTPMCLNDMHCMQCFTYVKNVCIHSNLYLFNIDKGENSCIGKKHFHNESRYSSAKSPCMTLLNSRQVRGGARGGAGGAAAPLSGKSSPPVGEYSKYVGEKLPSRRNAGEVGAILFCSI